MPSSNPISVPFEVHDKRVREEREARELAEVDRDRFERWWQGEKRDAEAALERAYFAERRAIEAEGRIAEAQKMAADLSGHTADKLAEMSHERTGAWDAFLTIRRRVEDLLPDLDEAITSFEEDSAHPNLVRVLREHRATLADSDPPIQADVGNEPDSSPLLTDDSDPPEEPTDCKPVDEDEFPPEIDAMIAEKIGATAREEETDRWPEMIQVAADLLDERGWTRPDYKGVPGTKGIPAFALVEDDIRDALHAAFDVAPNVLSPTEVQLVVDNLHMPVRRALPEAQKVRALWKRLNSYATEPAAQDTPKEETK